MAMRATATFPTGRARAPCLISPPARTTVVLETSTTLVSPVSSASPASPVPLDPTTAR